MMIRCTAKGINNIPSTFPPLKSYACHTSPHRNSGWRGKCLKTKQKIDDIMREEEGKETDAIFSNNTLYERETSHLISPLGPDWGANTSASLPVFWRPLCQLRSVFVEC